MKTPFQKSLGSYFAIILIIAGLGSCGKNPQGDSLNAGFKKYFDYQAGSKWYLYDSLYQRLDSFVVIQYSDEKANCCGTISNEMVTIGINGSDSTTWAIHLMAPYSADLQITYGYILLNYGLASNMPFNTGKILANKDSPVSYRQTILLPSYSVGGAVYNNVYQIIDTYVASSYSDTIYINSDNGFLEMLLNNRYFHKRLFLKGCSIIK